MQREDAITAIVIASVFGVMLIVERLRPLRATVEPKLRRIVRNAVTGGTAYAVALLIGTPLLIPVSRFVAAHHVGLLNVIGVRGAVRLVLAVVLLDYTLWFWHFANHRVPFLWRFHVVHHVDLDLDSSTALRFHFGEHALSYVYRAAQVVVIGASPEALWAWQLLLFAAILFHHANIQLPFGLERWLVRVIVTPRMHGIHHSDQFSETDSNWSSLLSAWDYLHGTILLSVPQREVTIGVPAWQNPRAVTLGRILLMPFRRQRRDFHDADGTLRTREHEAPGRLLAP